MNECPIETSGHEAADVFLRSFVHLMRSHLADKLRSIILIGSRSAGGYTERSDVDVCIFWKKGASRALREKAVSLTRDFVRQERKFWIDIVCNASEAAAYKREYVGMKGKITCGAIARFMLRHQSQLLYGEDIRSRVVLSDANDLYAELAKGAVFWIRCLHNPDPENPNVESLTIAYPLSAPDPNKDDLGYGNARRVAQSILSFARALVWRPDKELVVRKDRIAETYKSVIGGEWAQLVTDAHELTYTPLAEEDHGALYLSVCGRLLGFTNHFLGLLIEDGLGSALKADN